MMATWRASMPSDNSYCFLLKRTDFDQTWQEANNQLSLCTVTISIDQTLHQCANLAPNWILLPILTLLPNFRGFHRTLQRVRLANRGRLLLRTPGPVPFGTCTVLMLRPFDPELVMSTDLLSFEHPSVLLFSLSLCACFWWGASTKLATPASD